MRKPDVVGDRAAEEVALLWQQDDPPVQRLERRVAQGDAAETVLSGIDDVLNAESAIRRLSVDRSVTIISPVH